MHWFDDVLKEESHKASEEQNVDEKVHAPKQQSVGKNSRLTPFAVPFVPKFARAPQVPPAPAQVMPVYKAPIVFRPSFPQAARRASVDWAPTFTSLPRMPAPLIPTSRSMPPTHWAPAPIVPVVLEAPKRRGGRGGKANKSVDGAEPVKKGPSRKERHMKLMGVRAKESS
ncbi:hypothetical protein CPC08DRAFT_446945 [Agrocybe pediades]|nr:hypothetical protein CPC08DRAFT_446945 [Agrocybe pediades]